MWRVRVSALLLLFFVWPSTSTEATASAPAAEDERILRDAGLAIDDTALLEFFRQRTLTADHEARILALIAQLGNSSFRVRERASAELVALGLTAVPFLRQAVTARDPEIIHRAEACLRSIDQRGAGMGVPGAVARLLAARKPSGTTEVLLAFLPFAENDAVAEEVLAALCQAGVANGKPDPALLAALGDQLPARRAAAAEVLCRSCSVEFRAELRKLLRDPEPLVCLRTALGLAKAKDKEAVPVLIDMLATLPTALAWQAEDLLLRLADEQAPVVSLGGDAAARRKCRDAWASWWQEHGDKTDLSKLATTEVLLGYTLLVFLDAGQLVELGPDDKPRLRINGLELPLDAQMLPNGHVLIAEHNGNRVTERDDKGEVLWEVRIAQPLVAQRLANGNTFIATTARLLEVNREGQITAIHWEPAGDAIRKAVKLPGGDFACITTLRGFVRLDAKGKVLQSFPVNVPTSGGRIDVLPGRRVLVPEKDLNRVVEYDATGQVVWQARFVEPIAAVRLPNGHTLVTSYRLWQAVELDREGREVWKYEAPTRVTRAFRR
jgi:hypothetical protein